MRVEQVRLPLQSVSLRHHASADAGIGPDTVRGLDDLPPTALHDEGRPRASPPNVPEAPRAFILARPRNF
jgi:hypothetical protein